MNRNLILCGLLGLAVCGCSDNDNKGANDVAEVLPEFDMSVADVQALKQRSDLQAQMLGTVFTDNKDNYEENGALIFSPVSATMAMGMLANATDNATAGKLAAMCGHNGLDDLNAFNRRLLDYLPDQGTDNHITLCNALWVHDGCTTSQDFADRITSNYSASINTADFDDPSTAKSINEWASLKTSGKITNITEFTVLKQSKPLYVANAFCFDGKWATPFKKADTAPGLFNAIDGPSEVAKMSITANFIYAEDPQMQLVSLPFKNKRTDMLVLLPAEGTDALEYAASLTAQDIADLLKDGQITQVDLKLPKFDVKSVLSLSSIFDANGIAKNATLDGAGINSPLLTWLDQNVSLTVDEDGASMAAVTHTAMSTAETAKHREVDVNRPFVILLLENKTNTLFAAGVIGKIK